MLRPDTHREAGQSIFMSSMKGLANTGAAIAAFLLTPWAYSESVGPVQAFTARAYGYGFEDLVAFGWFVLLALLTFFIARASLATLLVMGGLAIATRLL